MHHVGEICVVDLHGGDVDRDGQRVGPGRRLAACRPKHPLADLKDHAGIFRNRNELDRCNFPPRRVLPAQQSLKADDPVVTDILLRLVDEPQLTIGNRIAQVVFQQTAVAHRRAHRSLEESIGSSPLILGAVKRGIGMGQQGVPIGGVVRTYGNSDARGDRRNSFLALAPGSQNLQDVFGDTAGDRRVGKSGHHDGELIAAQPRQHLAFVQNHCNSLRGGL